MHLTMTAEEGGLGQDSHVVQHKPELVTCKDKASEIMACLIQSTYLRLLADSLSRRDGAHNGASTASVHS